MKAPDFESNLNVALDRLFVDSPHGSAPRDPDAANLEPGAAEIDELVSVAQRLAVLAPAPALDLAKGRTRFLGEAERVLAQRSRPRWSWQRLVTRPALLAFMAAIVLFTGVAFTLLMMSGIMEPVNSPPVPVLATPLLSPTNTATPTRMAQRSTETMPSPVMESGHISLLAPQPEPIPAPIRPVDPIVRFHSELVLFKCLRL